MDMPHQRSERYCRQRVPGPRDTGSQTMEWGGNRDWEADGAKYDKPRYPFSLFTTHPFFRSHRSVRSTKTISDSCDVA